MLKTLFLSFILSLSTTALAQKPLVWELLSLTTYTIDAVDETNMDYHPNFPKILEDNYEGQEVLISGYLIPIDLETNQYALSKNPFSSCFFCGNAGPETVLELRFTEAPGRFATDEFVMIKGTLKLVRNGSGLFFVLKQAEIHG